MRALMVTIITLWAATCGQKGPLELPEPQAAQVALDTAHGAVAKHLDVDTERVDVS